MRIRSSREARDAVAGIFTAWWVGQAQWAIDAEVCRAAFHVDIVRTLVPRVGSEAPVVCDLGGGFGDVLCALASLGYEGVLVDDFADEGHARPDRRNDMWEAYGLQRISADVVADPLPFAPASIDAFTCRSNRWSIGTTPPRRCSRV